MEDNSPVEEIISEDVIMGRRLWKVQTVEGLARWEPHYVLRSLALPCVWEPRKRLEASCFRQEPKNVNHEVPFTSCVCGIYSMADQNLLEDYLVKHKLLPEYWNDIQRIPMECLKPNAIVCGAIGTVSLWGTVLEGQYGWRAQYAYPYAIELVGGSKEIAGNLRERYQIDVKIK